MEDIKKGKALLPRFNTVGDIERDLIVFQNTLNNLQFFVNNSDAQNDPDIDKNDADVETKPKRCIDTAITSIGNTIEYIKEALKKCQGRKVYQRIFNSYEEKMFSVNYKRGSFLIEHRGAKQLLPNFCSLFFKIGNCKVEVYEYQIKPAFEVLTKKSDGRIYYQKYFLY